MEAPIRTFRLFSIGLMALGLASLIAPRAAASPITYFSSSLTNFYSDSLVVNSIDTDFKANSTTSGRSNSVSVAEGTAGASASANLSSGQLKGFSTADGNPGPFGLTLYAFSRADFGDSFRSYSGSAPFSWAGKTATFSFDLSGTVNLTGAAENLSGFGLLLFQPGTLDSYARWINGEDTFDVWNSALIGQFDYVLGPGETFPGTTAQVTTFPTNVTASFQPGSDFDWAMYLITDIYLNGALGTQQGTADFANTIAVSYIAPAGATTFSGSGFPGTQQQPVPEPGTLLLLCTGIAAIGGSRLRKRRSRLFTCQKLQS